jgi:hypothetical protein
MNASEAIGAKVRVVRRPSLLEFVETAIVKVEEFPGGTLEGEKPHEASAGNPVQVNDTDPVNPSTAVTETVVVAVPPLFTVNETGLSDKVKSG